MMQRYILHLDVETFFASVGEILDPSLKGKQLIVGARPKQRGVVASASYAARTCASRRGRGMAGSAVDRGWRR